MTMSTTSRALTVGSALVLAASGVLGGVADAGDGTPSCTPTTRTLDTLTYSFALALSPHGHVVTQESNPGASGGLWLHYPDGVKAAITDANGSSPSGVSNVNGRGFVVGTERVQTEPGTFLYRPWVFRGEAVRLLTTPGKVGRNVRKDYFAAAVNSRSSVVGVKSNRDRFLSSDPEYVSRPVLWPTPGSTPIKLDLPNGSSVPSYPTPLVDIRNDGAIIGVVIDESGGYNLALWVTPGADPDLRPLPDAWVPQVIAGQWVAGRISGTDSVFLHSWNEAFTVDGPELLSVRGISGNGTFTVMVSDDTQTATSYIGSPTQPVAEIGYGLRANDVVGTSGGKVLLKRDDGSIEVISCALQLPEATDITVTPVDLPATKVSP
jgi:hypothetical protein